MSQQVRPDNKRVRSKEPVAITSNNNNNNNNNNNKLIPSQLILKMNPKKLTKNDNNADADKRTDKQTGNFANVYWRSISIAHLRRHPAFQPLPLSSEVDLCKLTSFADCGIFRQDSREWDLLHVGRLTTSRLAACLGLFENFSSQQLRIPHSLQGHSRAVDAWQLVRQKPLSWTDFIALSSNSLSTKQQQQPSSLPTGLWQKGLDGIDPFPYSYHPPPSPPSLSKTSQGPRVGSSDPMSARLCWGSAQESTAVLCALNYLLAKNAGDKGVVRVREAGMCLMEEMEIRDDSNNNNNNNSNNKSSNNNKRLQLYQQTLQWMKDGNNNNNNSLPLLGASPDGLLIHSDGTLEVLEVKCVSPFVRRDQSDNNNNNNNNTDTMGLREEISFSEPIAVWHVPQVQWEMFCAGPSCESCVAVTLGVKQATLCRVMRDDQYIEEMLRLLRLFFSNYVNNNQSNKLKPPPPNFFNNKTNGYDSFLQKTKAISQRAVVIVKLDNNQIQRSPFNESFFL